jgi:restriction system protein
MAAMPSWRDHQEEAAAFFRDLGLDATTDESIAGARSPHRVDVAVRTKRVGISQLWIVECKLWRRRLSKLHVEALSNIVQDIGADRGIMLSESGFQAGTILAAGHANITLTSLASLREDVGPDDVSAADLLRFLIDAFKSAARSSTPLFPAYRA